LAKRSSELSVVPNTSIDIFVESCVEALPNALYSIFYYPHPFTDGGFVVVLKGDVTDFLGYAGTIYANALPGYSLHVLRTNELDMLTAPGMFAPPMQINEKPHLPYYLKYKGECLYGQDIRDHVSLPDTQYLLTSHIEGCYDYLRRYGILSSLISQQYNSLAGALEREAHALMATAVLTQGMWEIDLATLEDLFFTTFSSSSLLEIYTQFKTLSFASPDPIMQSEIAEKVWLFESFLRKLKGVA
jgi:hypothetical protein